MRQRSTDDGFSLVEVIIAMVLLGALALAILPLIIGATRLSVTNRDVASATAFAEAKLAPVRGEFAANTLTPGTCTQANTYADSGTEPGGMDYVVTVSDEQPDDANNCPETDVGTLLVTVTVAKDGRTLATLKTRIVVTDE